MFERFCTQVDELIGVKLTTECNTTPALLSIYVYIYEDLMSGY